MEPEISTPQRGPEQAPIRYEQGIERGATLPTPERTVETAGETRERAPRADSQAAVAAALPTMLPTPVIGDVPVTDDAQTTSTGAPLVANDDDLIEKEWVEKAKKIVAETRDDPYQREQAVSQLQKDYLMKRYGRELGDA